LLGLAVVGAVIMPISGYTIFLLPQALFLIGRRTTRPASALQHASPGVRG
jgi:hypothetical protein